MKGNGTAPGAPGLPALWTTSSKMAVGTAIDSRSHVWFTISQGILNEIYYPLVQTPSTRDLELLVTDGERFFSEEKRDTDHQIDWLSQGTPAFRVTNTCRHGRYRLEKTIITDPARDVVLQRVTFSALRGRLGQYHVFVLFAPHLLNQGKGNSACVRNGQHPPVLLAQRDGAAVALGCSVPFRAMSCGYVGISDPWRDIREHKRLTQLYEEAPDGNVAMAAELDLSDGDGRFVMAVAFHKNAEEAARQASAAIEAGFDKCCESYQHQWAKFQSQTKRPQRSSAKLFETSVAVLKTHQSKVFPGGAIASLTIPWGSIQGDDQVRGYHLVWTRDLVECAGGLLAAGHLDAVQPVIEFLGKTQMPDGHWPQNMWLNGEPYETEIQMDETAFPILIANMLHRFGAARIDEVWPVIRKAAGFIVRKGPQTTEERWELKSGYSPSTLAVEISALLAAADFADQVGESSISKYLRQTADIWNQSIERWTYVVDTHLSRRFGIEGYYVQITPPHIACATSIDQGGLPHNNARFVEVVSPDALALVRFGLRAADDSRIRNTIRVIDATLRTETSTGPVWHRFTDDRYGEHDDGSPYDGNGKGRGWPLLTGERAHYELAAGNHAEARRLQRVLEAQSGPAGMIPEQVWDAPDIPSRELYNGHPSLSACPLAWAHAEYVKLVRSLADDKIFDCPPQTVHRYRQENIQTPLALWRFDHQAKTMTAGENLRLELLAPGTVHWTADNWHTAHDTTSRDSKLGVHYADLPTEKLKAGATVRFTFHWENGRWEGTDFEINIEPQNK